MGQLRSDPGYIPTLDGWRAVAIVAVMVSHAKPMLSAFGFGESVLEAATWGRLGVDLFFAISGFLICSRLIRENDAKGRISLLNYYLRRTFRIFPIYFAYLGVLSLLAALAGVPASRAEVCWSLVFLRNYVWMPDGVYTNHFWSLAVEEHFYLVWPLFLVLAKQRFAFWATPILGLGIHVWRSLDAAWHLFPTEISEAVILHRTDTRIDAILWGCFAALCCARYPNLRLPKWAGWAILAVLVGIILIAAPLISKLLAALYLVFALLFPLLIVSTALCPNSALARLLELGPIRWVGRLSFSLYIWQTFFLQNAPTPDPDWLATLKLWPINIFMVFICSVASHYLLELPAIRLGRRVVKHFTAHRGGKQN